MPYPLRHGATAGETPLHDTPFAHRARCTRVCARLCLRVVVCLCVVACVCGRCSQSVCVRVCCEGFCLRMLAPSPDIFDALRVYISHMDLVLRPTFLEGEGAGSALCVRLTFAIGSIDGRMAFGAQ